MGLKEIGRGRIGKIQRRQLVLPVHVGQVMVWSLLEEVKAMKV